MSTYTAPADKQPRHKLLPQAHTLFCERSNLLGGVGPLYILHEQKHLTSVELGKFNSALSSSRRRRISWPRALHLVITQNDLAFAKFRRLVQEPVRSERPGIGNRLAASHYLSQQPPGHRPEGETVMGVAEVEP